MTAPELLAEFEILTHSQRMRRIVEVGRQARQNADAQAILQALSSGGFYERYLALIACSGSGDGAHVLQALSDPSRTSRGLALKLIAVVCTDEQAQTALESLPTKTQVLLLRDLLRHKRRTPLDAFLTRLAETSSDTADVRLGQLLPFGSDGLVRRLLDRVSGRFSPNDWARLARLHPDVALDALGAQVRALTEADARVRTHVNVALPLLTKTRPDAALQLVRDLLRVEPPSALVLSGLSLRRPREIADLLLSSPDGNAGVDLSPRATHLTGEQMVALLQTRPAALVNRYRWLSRIAPDLRRTVYAVAAVGWRTSYGVLDPRTVGALPGEIRASEARRMLSLPILATRPVERLPYAAFLPWDEARAVLGPSIASPDADLRAVALPALIGTARYDPAHLSDALGVVRARNNEQDPVRRALLAALAGLPPSRWKPEHLEDLGQILTDALGAADLSPATASEAEKIVVRLAPFHPEWAANWLATLVRTRGQVTTRWETYFADRDVRAIAPLLLPVLATWESRERESLLVQVANGLGRRLEVFADLAPILERLAFSTRNVYTASSLLTLLAKHFRARFAQLVPRLLPSDPSTIMIAPVYEFLHRTRQDLLTPYLGQTAFKGRFQTGRTRWVLPLETGFHRWTLYQQATWARVLGEVANDLSRDVPSVLSVINQLAALPACGPEPLIGLASLDNTRPAVRDAALRALARLDGGQGIPTLTDALGDRRARIAIYALRTAILEMPAPAALALLRKVPTGKVTVAKEVVRLLGELDTPDAFPFLRAMARQDPPLHRDVRIALLRGLWGHLEQVETWQLFSEAASDPDVSLARAVVSIPADRLSADEQNHLRALLARLLEHPDPLVRLDTLARLASLPLSDGPRVLLPRLLARLGSPLPDECRASASAVFGTYTGTDAGTVGEAIQRILPDRHALHIAVHTLQVAFPRNRARLLPTLRAALAALDTDPLTVSLRLPLAVLGLPPGEIAALLERLSQTGQLHADAVSTAVRAVEGWLDRGGSVVEPLEILEVALRQSGEPSLRRIALAALVAQSTKTPGWTSDLRARLDGYRADPAPLVAAPAQFTFPPPEAETTPAPQ